VVIYRADNADVAVVRENGMEYIVARSGANIYIISKSLETLQKIVKIPLQRLSEELGKLRGRKYVIVSLRYEDSESPIPVDLVPDLDPLPKLGDNVYLGNSVVLKLPIRETVYMYWNGEKIEGLIVRDNEVKRFEQKVDASRFTDFLLSII
jgi:hypothetical protein